MKKLIITLAAVLISAAALSARPTGFNIGGGIGYLGWTSNTGDTPKDYIGPYVEVGYDLKVAKNSYVYFGGRFSHGLHANTEYIAGVNTYTMYNMGDLFIPIRFQQNFNIGRNSTFYIEAGPAAGFLLYNYAAMTAVDAPSSTSAHHVEDLTYKGEPRANFYLGGNIGFNINRHVKIYGGGDYGFVNFSQDSEFNVNRWQLNIGACYVF